MRKLEIVLLLYKKENTLKSSQEQGGTFLILAHVHEEIRKKLEESTKKNKKTANVYCRAKVIKEGDFVWVFLKKERRNDSYNKFKEKKIGPCQVLKKINDNAYEIELPPNINTHLTSNSQDLSAYHGEFWMAVHGQVLSHSWRMMYCQCGSHVMRVLSWKKLKTKSFIGFGVEA
jgi:hypothetical protein